MSLPSGTSIFDSSLQVLWIHRMCGQKCGLADAVSFASARRKVILGPIAGADWYSNIFFAACRSNCLRENCRDLCSKSPREELAQHRREIADFLMIPADRADSSRQVHVHVAVAALLVFRSSQTRMWLPQGSGCGFDLSQTGRRMFILVQSNPA